VYGTQGSPAAGIKGSYTDYLGAGKWEIYVCGGGAAGTGGDNACPGVGGGGGGFAMSTVTVPQGSIYKFTYNAGGAVTTRGTEDTVGLSWLKIPTLGINMQCTGGAIAAIGASTASGGTGSGGNTSNIDGGDGTRNCNTQATGGQWSRGGSCGIATTDPRFNYAGGAGGGTNNYSTSERGWGYGAGGAGSDRYGTNSPAIGIPGSVYCKKIS